MSIGLCTRWSVLLYAMHMRSGNCYYRSKIVMQKRHREDRPVVDFDPLSRLSGLDRRSITPQYPERSRGLRHPMRGHRFSRGLADTVN